MKKILEVILHHDKRHYLKLEKNISSFDNQYFIDSEIFYSEYEIYLKKINKNFEFAINAYLSMIRDMEYEYIKFIRSGRYSASSFDEVNEKVYANPTVMVGLLHGLILSQFLWKQHYETYRFFSLHFPDQLKINDSYLEIGAGHGLYISKVIRHFKSKINYTIIDISNSSIEFSRTFLNNKSVSYYCEDIYLFDSRLKYNFITMGEVIEHVEDPKALLIKVKNLLHDKGTLFITTPTNAPSIDHIYLFNDINEIRVLIKSCGFKILKENIVCSEDATKDEIKSKKISEMYSAFLAKK